MNEYFKKIYSAEVCPYCKSKTKQTSETDIYGRKYSGRMVVVCLNYPKCNSYVGCHKDGKPLGRLANKELRKAKIDAHNSFDRLWKENLIERSELYKRLSEHLEIPIEYTHIGMFNVNTCKEVQRWANEIYNYL